MSYLRRPYNNWVEFVDYVVIPIHVQGRGDELDAQTKMTYRELWDEAPPEFLMACLLVARNRVGGRDG